MLAFRFVAAGLYLSVLTVGAASVFADEALLDSFPRIETDIHASSLNWAGYAAQEGVYTGVKGSWIVSEIDPQGRHGAVATWVGIGGISGEDLIQAGTASVEDRLGTIDYFAWFEMLPDAAVPIPLDIAPGDAVTVELYEEAPTNWLIRVRNTTTEKEFSIPVRYNSSRSSAEWIQERPVIDGDEYIELSNFESVRFTDGQAIVDGEIVSIAESGARRIAMSDLKGEPLAIPTTLLDSGNSFSVARTRVEEAQGVIPIFSATRRGNDVLLTVRLLDYVFVVPLSS